MATATINNIPIYYEIHGTGRPLLLLHGLGSSGADWQFQVEYFQKRYQTITMDTRGHGRSGKPPGPYSVGQFAADTVDLLDYLEIAAAHVAGVSMGGMIAFQMAVDDPERLKSMVIINSAPSVIPSNFREKLNIWQRKYLFKVLSMERIGKTIGGRLFPEEGQEELYRQFVERWSKNDKAAYTEATKALIGWSVADHLGEITIPALVIASDQDYTPVESKRAYTEHLPEAELVVIENARHAVVVTHPERVNGLIESFLEKVEHKDMRP